MLMPTVLRGSEAEGVDSPIAVQPVRNGIRPESCSGGPLPALLVRRLWQAETEELTAAWVGDEVFVLSGARRLALTAILGVALLLPISSVVLAAWSVLDGSALDRTIGTIGRFEQFSHIAVLVQLGRFPLFLVLATLLARSPKEQ